MGSNGIGALLREGIFDIHLLSLNNPDGIIYHWEKHKEIIYERRTRWNNKRLYDMWEYLYDELIKHIKEHPELAL